MKYLFALVIGLGMITSAYADPKVLDGNWSTFQNLPNDQQKVIVTRGINGAVVSDILKDDLNRNQNDPTQVGKSLNKLLESIIKGLDSGVN